MPVGEMAALYEQERAKLATGAHITKFLHIFATRKVLEILSKRGPERRPAGRAKPALLAA
jgi:hypothetical protein